MLLADTPDGIYHYRLCVLRSRLKLECAGMKFRTSTYARIKREFGFKGSKQRVLEQFNQYISDYEEINYV